MTTTDSTTTPARAPGAVPALVQPEVLPPCPDIGTFLRRLGALHVDAKKLDWGDEQLARINASALCAMIADEIERG